MTVCFGDEEAVQEVQEAILVALALVVVATKTRKKMVFVICGERQRGSVAVLRISISVGVVAAGRETRFAVVMQLKLSKVEVAEEKILMMILAVVVVAVEEQAVGEEATLWPGRRWGHPSKHETATAARAHPQCHTMPVAVLTAGPTCHPTAKARQMQIQGEVATGCLLQHALRLLRHPHLPRTRSCRTSRSHPLLLHLLRRLLRPLQHHCAKFVAMRTQHDQEEKTITLKEFTLLWQAAFSSIHQIARAGTPQALDTCARLCSFLDPRAA